VTDFVGDVQASAQRRDGVELRPQHLPSLDGIRAGAFFLVFLAHAGLDSVLPGGFGVTVFFFLSGYLITTLLRIEHDASGRISLSQFYLRRALRILPPFYLVLGLAVVAAHWGLLPGGLQRGAVAAEALQLANYRIAVDGYHGMPAGTGVYWSLAVEEHFYLLFPLVFILFRRTRLSGRSQALILWLVCAGILAWRCVLVCLLHVSADRTGVGTDTRVDSILFGCALAVYRNPALDGPSKLTERAYKLAWLPASVALLGFTFVCRNPVFRETFRYTLQGVGLYIPMIVALRFPSWAPIRVLNLRPVAFVGVLSYSLYLVHHVVLNVVGSHLTASPAIRACVALALSIAYAWASFRIVEKPCAALRKRLSGVMRSRGTAPWRAPQSVTT
jgi:peptidoglycan/LPS O-acetylase OafA/YrhL